MNKKVSYILAQQHGALERRRTVLRLQGNGYEDARLRDMQNGIHLAAIALGVSSAEFKERCQEEAEVFDGTNTLGIRYVSNHATEAAAEKFVLKHQHEMKGELRIGRHYKDGWITYYEEQPTEQQKAAYEQSLKRLDVRV